MIKSVIPEIKKALDNPYTFTQRIASRLIEKSK
jgi:hypothetical protein